MLAAGRTDSLLSVRGHIFQLDFPGLELEPVAHQHPACVRIRSAVALNGSCPVQPSSRGRSTAAVTCFVDPSENREPAGRCGGSAGAGSESRRCLVLCSHPQSLLLPWGFVQLLLASTGVASTDCQGTWIPSVVHTEGDSSPHHHRWPCSSLVPAASEGMETAASHEGWDASAQQHWGTRSAAVSSASTD